jgi:hypothetical protein
VAAIKYFEPQWVGTPGLAAVPEVAYLPAVNAAFRKGDILQYITTGTLAFPSGGTGSTTAISTAAGPTFGAPVNVSSTAAQTSADGNVTITGVSSAGAPAQSYYVQLTWTATSNESLTGAEFVVNCAAGYLFSVQANTTHEPTGTTNFAAYIGEYPQTEVLQQASTTTTATGSAYTIANPLTNSAGVNRSVTNPSSNIVGLAVNNSSQHFYSGTGGAFTVGDQSLFGATNSQPPLTPAEPYLVYVAKLQMPAILEISFVQAWSIMYVGQTAGLTLDTTSGVFVADTTASNKILNIIGGSDGVSIGTSSVGTVGDTGKRILVQFNGGTV